MQDMRSTVDDTHGGAPIGVAVNGQHHTQGCYKAPEFERAEEHEFDTQAIIRQRWEHPTWTNHEHNERLDDDCDVEGTEDSTEKGSSDYDDDIDSDVDGPIDWASIEQGSGLSAWDQLGYQYETEASNISE